MTLVATTNFCLQLPGHKGTVTSVDFHPKEPISKQSPLPAQFYANILLRPVLTGSKDGTMLLGEIEPSLAV